MVEGLPYYIDDISYWVPDIIKTRQMVAAMQGVPFEGKIQAAAQSAAAEYRQGFPSNAHLDDGTYYPGMDSAKTTKPGVKAPAASTTKTPVKPPVKAPVPAKPSTTPPAKPAPAKPTSALPVRMAAELVNASGQAEAGNVIAGIMQSRGFEVLGISTAGTPVRATVVTSYTQHPSVISRLTSLPFRYVLNISEDPTREIPVRVLIGQDHGA
jgi:hypothetical protein